MRPPKIQLDARPDVRFRLPEKAIALWRKDLKGPTEGVTIQILAPIAQAWDDDDPVFSAKMMVAALKDANKSPITLNINSPGGDAFEGVTIYNLLVDYPAPITVNVLGEAASAASVIAMAGDKIRMYQGALFMIHRASGLLIGNSDDAEHFRDVLDKLDRSVAEIYVARSGNTTEKVLKLMADETWMTPDEAVANGFANEVVKQETKPAKAKQQAAPHAASGILRPVLVTLSKPSPGVSGISLKGTTMQVTTNERIAALENKRAATFARMQELEKIATDKGETFDLAQQQEFDTLDSEMESLDKQLVASKRIADLALRAAATITPTVATDPAVASQVRAPGGTPILSVRQNVEPGVPFARYAIAMARAEGNKTQALQIVQATRRWKDTPQVEQFLMAAVGAGTTGGAGWADDLVYARNLTSDFVQLLQAATIVDRIPGLRRVPFDIRVGTLASGLTGYWVGEARPIPLSKFATDVLPLTHHKVAGLTPISRELAESSEPSAETLVRDLLRAAIVKVMDLSFIDPERTAVAGVNPASVTNGVTAVSVTGTTVAALRTDVATLMNKFITAGIPTTGGVWIMTPSIALAISMMQNALGQPAFDGMNPEGGRFLGYPVVVSQTALTTGSPVGGNLLIFIIPSEIFIADSQTVDVVISREASLEMSDAPTNRADTGTGAAMVSMFQNDSLAIRGIRDITWVKARAAAAQFIVDAAYAA